jgi:hypothetical protein
MAVAPEFLHCVFEVFPQLCALADIQHIQNRFLAEEHETAKTLFIFWGHFEFAQRALGFEVGLGAFEQLKFFFNIRRAHLL